MQILVTGVSVQPHDPGFRFDVEPSPTGSTFRSSKRESASQQMSHWKLPEDIPEEKGRGVSLTIVQSMGFFLRFAEGVRRNLAVQAFRLLDALSPRIVHGILIPDASSVLLRFVRSRAFEEFSFIMILLNAIFVGSSVDYDARHFDVPAGERVDGDHYRVLQVLLATLFVLEVSIRVLGERLLFFTSHDLSWNMFDLSICLVTFSEVMVQLLFDGNLGVVSSNIIVIRMVRLVRVVRILRVIRTMSIFSELRLMILQIAASLRVLFWVLIFLMIIMYIVSLVVMQGVKDYLANTLGGVLSTSEAEFLYESFGDLGSSIFTLYTAVTGGDDWNSIARHVKLTGRFYWFVFCAYITFMLFAVMNIVTAVFVEHAMQALAQDEDELELKVALEDDDAFVETMRALFEVAVCDSDSECLSLGQLASLFDDKHVRGRLKRLGLEAEAAHLFHLLDETGRGHVSEDDFAFGCLRLRGMARGVDVAAVASENRLMLQALASQVNDAKDELLSNLAQLCVLRPSSPALEGRPLAPSAGDDESGPSDRTKQLLIPTAVANSEGHKGTGGFASCSLRTDVVSEPESHSSVGDVPETGANVKYIS